MADTQKTSDAQVMDTTGAPDAAPDAVTGADQRVDYLIVGNSAAGVTAAEQIRMHDDQASILIVGDEPYPAYGRPLISYLLEGKTTEDRMAFKSDDFYERHRIEALLGPEYRATALDAAARQLRLANGTQITYRSCLIATGSVPFTPPIAGLEGKRNVFHFLTLDDAKAACAAADEAARAAREAGRASRIVVIGAGLIGLKAAEALSYHVDEVLVLELAPRILPAVLDDEGASILARMLADRGVCTMPGVSAQELVGNDDLVGACTLTNGDTVDCDLVIAAVGVRPNTALAADAGAEVGRGLICGSDLMTSLPDVYAAGDVVQVTDLLDGEERPLALWSNAVRQGACAALHMVGASEAEPFLGNFAVNAVDFFDISLLTSGIINPPEDADYEVRVMRQPNSYAKFVIDGDVLVGYILLNRPANAGIYTSLIEERTPLSSLSDDPFGEAPLNIDYPLDARWERLHKFYPKELDSRGWKEECHG